MYYEGMKDEDRAQDDGFGHTVGEAVDILNSLSEEAQELLRRRVKLSLANAIFSGADLKYPPMAYQVGQWLAQHSLAALILDGYVTLTDKGVQSLTVDEPVAPVDNVLPLFDNLGEVAQQRADAAEDGVPRNDWPSFEDGV